MDNKQKAITVEIGHFPQDLDEETYHKILDAAYYFAISLPGHGEWPISWRIDMQKWFQAAAVHFGNTEFLCPWHDPDKELPLPGAKVMVLIPSIDPHKPFWICDARRPAAKDMDPQAYYDRYGFEELIDEPVAWAYVPELPQWIIDKLENHINKK